MDFKFLPPPPPDQIKVLRRKPLPPKPPIGLIMIGHPLAARKLYNEYKFYQQHFDYVPFDELHFLLLYNSLDIWFTKQLIKELPSQMLIKSCTVLEDQGYGSLLKKC